MIRNINNPKHKALISWLRSVREERGLSVRDLGKILDEPFQLIHKVEKGRRNLSAYELVQYCEALDIEPKTAIDIMVGSSIKN